MLLDFLRGVADTHGAASLEGAIVFVACRRDLDDAIRLAMAHNPHHPGEPAPWSHCFLLAAPFTGASTPILDCAIRDASGANIWDLGPMDAAKMLCTAIEGKAGGIYCSTLGDFEDPHVIDFGVKFLQVTAEQRRSIVDAGFELRAEGYHYDFPGLFRELARLFCGITIPEHRKLLFCSAFTQLAYRRALGKEGDFAPTLADDDVDPDALWFGEVPNQIVLRKTTPPLAATLAI
jgi:hypothetical protein